MGFWVALPLFVLSLTGAWISFPAFFAGLTGQGGAPRGPDRGAMMRAQPLADPAQPIAAIVAGATPLANGARLRSIAWPTDKAPDWTVTFASEGAGAPLAIKVADDTGTATPAAAAARPQPGIARLMRRIHDGDGMGIVWQVIIFIGGILPAVLAVTGIIMWWRARGWKAELAAKQRARQSSAAG
jgi:uncharacterized iron-regulated membrane protein